MVDGTGAPPGERRWSNSLQARLIASHAVAILIALGLVLLISSAFLRRYERQASERQLAQLAVPLLAEVNLARFGTVMSEVRSNRRIEAIDAQAEAMELRILVLDSSGTVLYDTSSGADIRGISIAGYSGLTSHLIQQARRDGDIHYVYREPGGQSEFAGQRLLLAAGNTGPLPARNAILMATESPRFPLLALFLPRLLLVTGISLILASGVALVLSRRLARPVLKLTAAADAMARGQLEQQVPAGGPDEIERLVRSFNAMSHRVARTHRSQRDLLANVAHELRTPLTSIQGYAKAIRDGVIKDEREQTRALNIIGEESERMRQLIAELLDLARLESGQTVLTMQPVPVTTLLHEVNERFRPHAAAKQIDLKTHGPAHLAVLGDQSRLLQMLSNLVENALRHTPEGGSVDVTAERIDVHPGVRLKVCDSGEGIPPDRLSRIFDRFERGESTNAGFGLGLAIVHELVQRHGGRIAVTSTEGVGTTFTIDLPAAEWARNAG